MVSIKVYAIYEMLAMVTISTRLAMYLQDGLDAAPQECGSFARLAHGGEYIYIYIYIGSCKLFDLVENSGFEKPAKATPGPAVLQIFQI